MIVYLEDPNLSAQNLLKLIRNFSKDSGYKSMCRKQKHSYTPITDREPNHERTLIHNSYKKIKIPRNVKDLYKENYKTLLKEIRDDTNKWKNTPYS